MDQRNRPKIIGRIIGLICWDKFAVNLANGRDVLVSLYSLPAADLERRHLRSESSKKIP